MKSGILWVHLHQCFLAGEHLAPADYPMMGLGVGTTVGGIAGMSVGAGTTVVERGLGISGTALGAGAVVRGAGTGAGAGGLPAHCNLG